jgi:hypothetical protein
VKIIQNDSLSLKQGDDCCVEDLLSGELAGLRLDESKFNDGRQDELEFGSEREASKVNVDVIVRGGVVKPEFQGANNSQFEVKIGVPRYGHSCTGEEDLWSEAIRDISNFMELSKS